MRSTLLIGLMGVGLLAGCEGHGRYTSEHRSAAQEKLAAVKAKTEYDMAKQAFLAGNLEKALRDVNNAITRHPGVSKSFVLLGRIQIERGQIGEAVSALNEASAVNPGDVEAQYYLGVAYERLQQPERALSYFKAAAELDPYDPQYAISVAEILIDLDRVNEAVAFLIEHESGEFNAGIRQLLGHAASIQGDPIEAVERFAEARLLSPDDPVLLENLIRAQIDAGQFADAERNIARLISDKSHAMRPDLKRLRATCLLELDRPGDAKKLFEEVAQNPLYHSDIDLWIGLARAGLVLEDTNTVRRASSRVIALDRNRPDGYVLSALWRLSEGDAVAALEALDGSSDRFTATAEFRMTRGLVLVELNRLDEAKNEMIAALRIDPDYSPATGMLEALSARYTSVPVE